tara:strand:- start:161 stop:694 length:534 start_codon:yes stop_codon:yes gene_type:complete
MFMIKLIVATGLNGEIGKGNTLLWHLPKDLALFKKKTFDDAVIMGNSTYMSLPMYPMSLPDRESIVLSTEKREDFSFGQDDEIMFYSNIETLVQHITYGQKRYPEYVDWIIGGASIYRQLEHLVDEIHVTEVQANYPEADKFYSPNLEGFTEDVSQRVNVSSEDLKAAVKVYIRDNK